VLLFVAGCRDRLHLSLRIKLTFWLPCQYAAAIMRNPDANNIEKPGFTDLGPNQVLLAVESAGFRCDGSLLPLNSYENRVYQVGLEDQPPVIAKFYRPGRWSDEAIQEEHDFTLELYRQELPVIAPLQGQEGQTLFRVTGHRFALFPRCGGRAPELDDPAHLAMLGRFIGRVHAIAAVRPFRHRPLLDISHFAVDSRRYLLENAIIPGDLIPAYETLTADLIVRIRACFQRAGTVSNLRLHGDCHAGNIIWTGMGPCLVDFDDVRMGPAIQDLWMFLSGERNDMTAGLDTILSAYTAFYDFDLRELHLLEALRTMRMLHHAAWLARRWADPAFPRAFPWFDSSRYWEAHILSLREQAALLDEPPLSWQ